MEDLFGHMKAYRPEEPDGKFSGVILAPCATVSQEGLPLGLYLNLKKDTFIFYAVN